MNGIKLWSAAVCMAALGCAAVRLLATKAGSGKMFRLMTSTFFVCALLLPMSELCVSFSPNMDLLPSAVVDDLLEERVTEQLSEQVRETVTSLVTATLKEYGVTAEKITVITDISPNGAIYMKQVTVCVDKQNAAQVAMVREVLQAQLQTEVVIKE